MSTAGFTDLPTAARDEIERQRYAEKMQGFHPGERVWWMRASRGGYGFVSKVPCEVVGRTRRRVVLRVDGSGRLVRARPENVQRPQ